MFAYTLSKNNAMETEKNVLFYKRLYIKTLVEEFEICFNFKIYICVFF